MKVLSFVWYLFPFIVLKPERLKAYYKQYAYSYTPVSLFVNTKTKSNTIRQVQQLT